MEKRWICKRKGPKQRTQKRIRGRNRRWGKGREEKGRKIEGRREKQVKGLDWTPFLAQRSGSFKFEFGINNKEKN